MAPNLLTTYVTHDTRHDLVSLFWLLLWVVLRYTETTCWPPFDEYLSTFGSQTEGLSAKDKYFFLGQPIEWQLLVTHR